MNFDTPTRVMLIQSLVLSLINYCSKIWGMTNKQQIERVQKLQNFAAKVADGNARKYDHVSPILNNLEWLRVNEKIRFDICVTVYKALHKQYPSWLFSLHTRYLVRSRTTRQDNELVIKRSSTDIGKNCFSIMGPIMWNSLPTKLRAASSLSSFKKMLKCHIIDSRPQT